jgi:hypothetical protein
LKFCRSNVHSVNLFFRSNVHALLLQQMFMNSTHCEAFNTSCFRLQTLNLRKYLKTMRTIERSSPHLVVLTCKVLHEFVLIDQLLSFSQNSKQTLNLRKYNKPKQKVRLFLSKLYIVCVNFEIHSKRNSKYM